MMVDRTVTIWRESILPASETFIAAQAGHLTRWRPWLVGSRRVLSPLRLPPSEVLFGDGTVGLARSRAFVVSGRSRRLSTLLAGTDLVHAHFGTDATLLLGALSRCETPLIVTFHGHDVTRLPSTFKERLARRRLPALIERAEFLVGVSDFICDQLTQLGAPANKVVRHYIGIESHADNATSHARSGIVFVGRLVEKKGVGDLLAAVARLPDALRRTPVTIVGDGPLRPALERMAQSLTVTAQFVGSASPGSVRAILATAAVFAGPSRRAADGDAEGLGMVFLEAAEAALPVVAYRHGGVEEAVVHGKTGLLANEGDVEELSRHLASLLLSPDVAATMGAAGQHRVRRQFNVVQQTLELEALYDRAVDRSDGTGR